MLLNLASAATPTISTVMGTVATGQTLTITGMNMVQEITGDYTPSQGGFEGSSVLNDGWTECVNGDCAYDSSVYLLGSKSFRSDVSGNVTSGCPSNNSMGDSIYRVMSRYVRLYVSFSSSFNAIWSTAAYTKMIEYVSPTGVYVQPQPAPGGPTQVWTSITGGVEKYMNLPQKWETGHWYCIEYYVAPNGLTVWVDGVQIGTNNGPIDFGAPYPQIGIVNACPVNGSGQMYIDGVMSSSTRVYPASAIEMRGSAGIWKYQEPVFLEDGTVVVKADLTDLGSAPYYLRVINNQQQMSAEYSLSGTPVTTPPAAPTGLTVQ